MDMKQVLAAAVIGLAVALPAGASTPEETAYVEGLKQLHWIEAPASAPIAANAHVKLGNGLLALGAADTDKFLQLNGNLPSADSFLVAAPDLRWFAVFSFDPSGYVKDNEKIDPDELLSSLKEQNKAGEEERKKRGLGSLKLEGWYVPPHYDTQTKRLEWGTRLRDDENRELVNYSTRILGRHGVMSAVLVSSPQNLDKDVAEFKTAMQDFSFDKGETYAEFRNGDKVAEYGLAALVVGGAAAAAMKGGAGFIKVIGIAVIGAFAAAWRFIKRLFNKES
jgi:uncharacterized membrane-anchored protein